MLLAAAINSREVCEQIEGVELTEEGAGVLRAIRTLYAGDESAASLPREAVEAVIRAQVHDDKVADVRCEYLAQLPTTTDGTARTMLHAIRLKNKRLGLVDALLRDVPPETLPAHLEEYSLMLEGVEDDGCEVTLQDLLTSTSDKVPVKPDSLNEYLNGGLRRGHTVLIFGRPGACKTLLCVEMASGLANKGLKGLYVGNEEAGAILLMRFLSRMGGVPLSRLDGADSKESADAITHAHANAMRRGLQNIRIVEGITSFPIVMQMVKEYQPDFIVIDQLRHMSAGGDGMTQQMEAAMRALRSACTKHDMIGIAVAQAGQSGEGKAVLGMGDLDSSKTGTQGAVDVIIGCGVNAELLSQNRRVLSICRNKVSGNLGTIGVVVDTQHTKVVP